MTRTSQKRIRKSPLLVSSLHKNWDTTAKQKMIRMSVRKLKKIGDPESLLCRAVLINNTLETVKNYNSFHSCNVERSQYSHAEEMILNTVRIPSVQQNHDSMYTNYCSQSVSDTTHIVTDNKETLSLSSTITLPEPISPLSDDEDSYNIIEDHTTINNKNSCLQLGQQTENFATDMLTCDRNTEYLLENDRSAFNRYLSLYSNSDLYDHKSIVAA